MILADISWFNVICYHQISKFGAADPGLYITIGPIVTVVQYYAKVSLKFVKSFCDVIVNQWWAVCVLLMRPCLNELQKEYCVKIKLVALDWQWVTLIFWCQMNRLGHSSRVMHKVEGKTHKFFEKLKITSQKSTLFGHFFVK